MKIEGRTFVVTGGASGLGRATVDMIIKNGGNAAILDLNEGQGNKAASELGSSVRFFQCDVTETESITKAVEGTVAWVKQSGRPLGGIIPAAGVGNPATILDRHGAPFSLDHFDFVMNINVRGTIDTVRQFLAHLAKVDPSSPTTSAASSPTAPPRLPMEAAMSEKTRAQLLKATEYPPRQGQPTEFAQIVQQAIENVMLNGTVLRLDGALRLPSKF
ncbi:unnamed protein product [Parascedosporium putredinis]|uniref:3-hydroxyacyl-CoA dehydrogenase n=1 Tax=Parascedosporium putredinis TaxID=1442378 RepID=A0A9P1HAI1_9PEZI|nr:unnamed protein product [Parascedosporium putredinis]CAI8001854.1 unnamed protein product [Parascedosporium putredinis]